ncbi:GGDEF domain-containing protein [Arcobacter sp. F2176]|uniref:GGDEF domain-containing protein n=1 Tax=Arcobacter sp. F2176 TaxID=2044511 RepID=UPI00100C006F|nr:GGDEF domain-containing protein [Arcobacter sp. F2176]RXJ79522.1 diguanylate cyclase [Arcobacter sp. F2176]
MKKALFLFIILPILLFADEYKKVTLQLNWLNQFQFAGYYVAKEKGFYKDVGLDVDIKEYTFNTDLVNSIKTKKADFAIGRSSLLIEKAKGEDVVALGAIFQESPLMLLVRKDSHIVSVRDLKDKKIMITPDAAFSASLLAMLSANGLNKNDFTIQRHSFKLDDLISRNTDAMASYLSNEPINLDEKEIKYKIFKPKDYGFDFYSDILFTSNSFIINNPKITKDFYEASIKGWKYAFEHKAETAEIIYKKYNSQNKSYIHLIKEGEILEKLAYANNTDIGDISNKKLQSIFNVFKLFGLVKNDIDIDSFIYDENPHKTMNLEISPAKQKLFFIILFFIIIVFLIVLFILKKNKQLKEQLQTVIDATDDFILYKDNKFRYLGCNKSFEKFVGKKKPEIIGKNDFELFSKEYAKLFRKRDMEAINLNSIQINHECVIYENKKIILQSKVIPFKYKKTKKEGILAICRDITELHEAHEKLKKEAYHDELTNIFNRKAFNERIEEKFDLYYRYKNEFCIAMYDIDDFKYINDTFGHDIGDRVLIDMTKYIKQHIRKTDFIFRVGGEEFVILFPKTLLEEALVVIEKIRVDVSNMNLVENKKVTISIGITQVRENDTPASIYERIDKLMYVSKHEGKNRTSKD